MTEITLNIEGMSCQHCVMNVKKAVDSIAGVASSEVSVGTAKVKYDEARTNKDTIALAVKNAGYKVVDQG